MKELGSQPSLEQSLRGPQPTLDAEIAPGMFPERDLSGITHIIESVKNTSPHSLPRTKDMIMRGNLTSPRESGIPFYTAAKVLEHYGKEKTLPSITYARNLATSEARERTSYEAEDTFEASLQKISQNNPYEAVVLQRPWTGVIKGLYSDMFGHLPAGMAEEQHIAASKDNGKNDKTEQEGREYSESLWRELFSLAEIQPLGEKLLTGQTQMNGSDYDAMLHTSVSLLDNEGKKKQQLTQSDVEAMATQRVQEDIGDDPQTLLKDRSTSMLYEHLTGEPLWDFRSTEPLANFFMEFYRERSDHFNWNKNPETRPDAMLEAFVSWVNPTIKRDYSLDTQGKLKMPRENVNALVASQKEVTVTDVDAYLDFDNRLDPVLSNLFGKPVDMVEVQRKFERMVFKINTSGKVVERTYKSPEEIIASVFEELGIDDPVTRFEMIAHSESELKGWFGAHKHSDLDPTLQNENYFNQGLAIKLVLDAELLKAGVEKQGWVPTQKTEGGILASIAQYFTEHPAEWIVRNYGEMAEDWNTGHIEQPKPHAYFNAQAIVDEDELSKYKPHRSESERYLVGAKKLIEQGEVSGLDTSLHHILTHELFPIQQMFAVTGHSPEAMRAVFTDKMRELPEDMSPLTKVRKVSTELRSALEFNTFKARYEAQYEIDIQGSDRIMRRLIEHTNGKEIHTGLTQQILEFDCGDSRNEARRVAIENASDNIATVGVAGHFGIPYDAIKAVPVMSETQRKSLKEVFAQLKSGDEKLTKESVVAKLKLLGAETTEILEESWETFKHSMEVPAFLEGVSAKGFEFAAGSFAAQLVNMAMGEQVEHLSPGFHKRVSHAKESALGGITYTLDIMKSDPERYDYIHAEMTKRLAKANETNTFEDWEKVYEYESLANTKIGADFVEGFLDMSSLDVKQWRPGSTEPKLIALGGHGAHVHSNNMDSPAYECGACGANSGERNAQVMADLFNNPYVREELNTRGINLENIYAVGGIYNTTTSVMEWNVPEAFKQNDALKPLLSELEEVTKLADTEARMHHETYLKGGVEYSLINKVKSKTVWRNKSKQEQDELAVLSNAYARSESAHEVQPEGGNGWSNSVVFAHRAYLRGIVADELSTTFHVNPVMGDMVGTGPVGVFSGVYAGIRNTYYEGQQDIENAVWKAQQTWNHTGNRVWALNSAGDRDVYGGLSRQMFNGRKSEPTRANYNFIAPMEVVLQTVENTPVLKQILDLGYGIATAKTEDGVYRYVSPAHKFVMTGKEEEGSWEPVTYLTGQVTAPVSTETSVFDVAYVDASRVN